jgi:hypothetical protein
MELVHLVVPLERRADAIALSHECTILFQCADGDTVMAMASLSGDLGACGVWLDVSTDYPAQMVARDVKTLSTLVPLRHVVVESSRAEEHADVVRALLTNDEVNFTNDVATIRGAYNRPVPPHPITVWHYDGKLRSDRDVLRPTRVGKSNGVELTYFG